MPIVFPYGISFFDSGHVSLFPAVNVTTITKGGDAVTLRFIIDSGATYSILPRSDAGALGIDLESGQQMNIGSISGDEFRGWLHRVDAQIGEEKISLPAIFLDDLRAPRVLGREGIFSRFMIIFDEQKFQSTFIHRDDPTISVIRNLLGGMG